MGNQEQTEDFLANVCPIDPDELESCQVCQVFSQPDLIRRNRRVVR